MARQPMDPFARRMLQGTFVYGGVMLVMFAVLTVVYLHTRPRCSDLVAAEAASPGRQWTAAVMERRCGEDAPFFTPVNVRPAAADVSRGVFSGSANQGEVFLLEQDAAGAGIAVEWTAANSLTVHCARCNAALVQKHDERWNGVTLKYDIPVHH